MPVLNLEKGKIEVKNKDSTKAELVIFGEITSNKWSDDEIEPKDVKELLDEIKDKDLDIYINSPGGSVFAGLAIHNMLARHKGYKKIYIEGYAASIASVIAMAGDEIIIPENAYLMIHKAWGLAIGNADDLRERANLYERLDSTIANAYMSKAKEGVTEEKFLELMKAESWFNGKEAQEYFNLTLGEGNNTKACLEGELYKNYKLPKELKTKAQEQKQIENNKENDDFGSSEMDIAKAKLKLLIEL